MNRTNASLLFFATALLVGGCSGGSHSMGSPGGDPMPAPTAETDLVAFVRAGMTDPEYVDAREVNGVTFQSTEDPDAFADWF